MAGNSIAGDRLSASCEIGSPFMYNNDPEKRANAGNRILSASVGAGLAATYSAARGHSLLGCLMVMSAALVFTLVLDELGWI